MMKDTSEMKGEGTIEGMTTDLSSTEQKKEITVTEGLIEEITFEKNLTIEIEEEGIKEMIILMIETESLSNLDMTAMTTTDLVAIDFLFTLASINNKDSKIIFPEDTLRRKLLRKAVPEEIAHH